MVKLENIQGIGKKLKDKILEYFADEETAVKALKSGMAGIVSGISQKQAVKFARTIFELEYNAKLEDVLKTENIIEIYQDVLNYISDYFVTEYSRNKISLFFPLGPKNLELIKSRYSVYDRALRLVRNYGEDLRKKNLLENLKKLSLFKKEDFSSKIKDRCIVTDSKIVMEFLKEEEINKIISCELINPEKISDPDAFFKSYADTFETILFICNRTNIMPDYMNFILLNPKEDLNWEALIPEKIILQFSKNQKIIDSIYNIAKIMLDIRDKSLISEFLNVVDLNKIETLQNNTKILDQNGNIVRGYNKNLDIYREDDKNFGGYIVEIESWINDTIKEEVEKSSVTLKGDRILDFFRSNVSIEQVKQYLPAEIDDLINDTIETGISQIEKTFHLTSRERSWTANLYPEVVEIPISLNANTIDQLEFNIKKRASVYNYNIMREIAEKLKENQNYLDELIWIMLEFDFFYGIGRFSNEFRLNIPEIIIEQHGIALKNSYNLELMFETINNNAKTIPINYQVGNIKTDFNNSNYSRLNLLSGSNSGGKTMCLLTVAESLILGQMGFPCPGIVKFRPFSEIYFFKKSSGQISAGAFESTLLMFVELAQSSLEKIILADELEAITEPNAAAKVISALFSLLLENPDNYAIFVTHLIELLMQNLSKEETSQIRVDGIEAKGLNENLELIVDRSPHFNYIARSTPEFIMERLSKTGDSERRLFFQKVLKKFQDKN